MKLKNMSVILIMSTILALFGCTKNIPQNYNNNQEPFNEQDKVDNKQTEAIKTVILYFPDDNAEYVLPEARIVKNIEPFELLRELQKGSLVRNKKFMFSNDIIIKSVSVKDKIAIIDFDMSIYGKITGSAGETLTLASIINTLTLNKELGIDKVQFDVNGIPMETLGGHVDISLPQGSMKEYIKK